MSMLSRRDVIKGLGGLAAFGNESARAVTRRSGWIDVHHHFIPPAFREFYESARTPSGGAVVAPPMHWELSRDLEDMERGGTSTAMLSIFVPYGVGTAETRRHLARDINEYAARLVSDHPTRFGRFAALPMPDVGACLEELSYALDVLKADGVTVYTNVGDRWIGDSSFEELHAELNRRKAVVFVHPTAANCCRGLLAGVPDHVIEYGTDTTRAIASVVFGQVTTRFPEIRFVFSHGGGTMPFLIERFLTGTSANLGGFQINGQPGPYAPRQPPNGALAELRRLHFDTAQCANPVAMRALRDVVGTERILFGTDYFYRSAGETRRALETCGVFDRAALSSVGSMNARRLLTTIRA